MKRELQVYELAPYLPYQLKIVGKNIGSISEQDIRELCAISDTSVNVKGRQLHNGMWADISDVKPLLIPLSKLYQPVDGTIHANILYRKFDVTDMEFNGNITDPKWGYEVYIYLFEHHFDIFGLIEQGLAIDKTTIKS